MVEVFPFILIIIGWNPDKPAETMVLQHSLHISAEVCEREGTKFVSERAWMKDAYDPAEFKHVCIAAPTPDEYEGVFDGRDGTGE